MRVQAELGLEYRWKAQWDFLEPLFTWLDGVRMSMRLPNSFEDDVPQLFVFLLLGTLAWYWGRKY